MEPAVLAVARESMTLLFTTREPLPVSALEKRHKTKADVPALLAELAATGHLVYGEDGLIVGVCGLSVVPTGHELRAGGEVRWTWCAWDALSFAVLIGGTSEVATVSPATQVPITVQFTDGEAAAEPATAVLLYAERPGECVTVRDWCPLVNMFEDTQTAQAWMEHNDVAGEIQEIGPAAKSGAESFRPLLDLTPQPPERKRRRRLSRHP